MIVDVRYKMGKELGTGANKMFEEYRIQNGDEQSQHSIFAAKK